MPDPKVIKNMLKPLYPSGNCYTPSTKTMRIVHMPPKKRPPAQLFGPLGPNGETQFPPLRPWAEREKERLAKLEREKERNVAPKGTGLMLMFWCVLLTTDSLITFIVTLLGTSML